MRRSVSVLVVSAASFFGWAANVKAADEPTPQAIIDRALSAGGGAEKIGQFKAVSFNADIKVVDKKVQFKGLFAGPTLFRIEMDLKDKGAVILIGGGDTF